MVDAPLITDTGTQLQSSDMAPRIYINGKLYDKADAKISV